MNLTTLQTEVLNNNLHQAHSLIEFIQCASIDSTYPSDTLLNWQREIALLFILLDDIRGALHSKQ
jgi:hypothetical protein